MKTPQPLPRHARCTPDDPAARRAAPPLTFLLLDRAGRPLGAPHALFSRAKAALDATRGARAVQCAACKSLLATRDGGVVAAAAAAVARGAAAPPPAARGGGRRRRGDAREEAGLPALLDDGADGGVGPGAGGVAGEWDL